MTDRPRDRTTGAPGVTDRPDERPTVERLVEQALFGPLDLAIRIVQDLPTTVDSVRRHLLLARFVGKLAVDQGIVQVRRRVEGSPGVVTGRPTIAREPMRPGRTPPDPDTPATAGGDGAAPAADDLALPDYEQLPAAHVVAKLARLTQEERDDIERFETRHRNRRTVLGKLDQLRVGS